MAIFLRPNEKARLQATICGSADGLSLWNHSVSIILIFALTVGKRHLSQKDAAVEAVRNIGLNQVRQVEHTVFSEHPAWKATFEERLRVLRNAM